MNRENNNNYFHLSTLSCFILGCCFSPISFAEMYFPEGLIDEKNRAALSMFNSETGQLPGIYPVKVYLNGKEVDKKGILFVPAEKAEDNQAIRDKTGLMACLKLDDIQQLGINLNQFPALEKMDKEGCLSLGEFITGAFTEFDFQKMLLNISIPQAVFPKKIKGDISPEKWDEGINAALLNYSISGNQRFGRSGHSNNHYIRLNSGLNLGPWRLRDQRSWSIYNSPNHSYHKWQHINTYAERAIIPFRSQLIVGDGRTEGNIFDPQGFRGVQIATDETMYPDSQHGFVPVVKGTAYSNAQVIIRQNNYVIYQTLVPPGPFSITDLHQTGSSGDLEITVQEADGSSQTFTVANASLPLMVREGHVKYSATVGQLRANSDQYHSPVFFQGTLNWGLKGGITAYGGTQLANNYQAFTAGAGINMGKLGAISADVTQANSTLIDGSRHQGQSMRFLYSWSLAQTNTSFNLAGYRYSTRGFHTLDETALKEMSNRLHGSNSRNEQSSSIKQTNTDYYNLYNSKKGRFEANIIQKLGDLGSLYLNGVQQSYWHGQKSHYSWQTGFNSSISNISYSLFWSQQKSQSQVRADKSLSLSVSFPLDSLFSARDQMSSHSSLHASFNATRDNKGNITQQAGLNGSLLADNKLNWSVSQGYSRHNRGSGNASLNYRSALGESQLGYSYSSNYQTVNYGFSGGAVLHSDGVTLGQTLGSNNVLISAPQGAGTELENESGVRLNSSGMAIKPWAMAYRENSIALNAKSLPEGADWDGTTQKVIPTKGAIVKANFTVQKGQRVLMTLKYKNALLPFGTMVTADKSSGIVNDDGQVYLSGLSEEGELKAQWGSAAGQQCTVRYRLPENDKLSPVNRVTADCQ